MKPRVAAALLALLAGVAGAGWFVLSGREPSACRAIRVRDAQVRTASELRSGVAEIDASLERSGGSVWSAPQFLTIEFGVSRDRTAVRERRGLEVDIEATLVAQRTGARETTRFRDVHVGSASIDGRWIADIQLAARDRDDRPWVVDWVDQSNIKTKIVACASLDPNVSMLARRLGRTDLSDPYWGSQVDGWTDAQVEFEPDRSFRGARLVCGYRNTKTLTIGSWYGGWVAITTEGSGSDATLTPTECALLLAQSVSAQAMDIPMNVDFTQYLERRAP